MDKLAQHNIENAVGGLTKAFHKLMRHKIREILLVSSLYDNYLFEEDGRLYELIREEYQVLNLSQAPEITHVTTGYEALELLSKPNQFDMVITTLHIEDMHVVKLANELKALNNNMLVVLLAYDNMERKDITSHYDASIFDKIFIWQGDYRLIIGIIKYAEDKLNADNDILEVGVQAVILVEDNVKFYSAYLPLIYTEIFKQSQRLINEGVNLTHKFLRMRARPKILLCTNYEEAWYYFERYKNYVLGIITDINFKLRGEKDPEAGIKFAAAVKAEQKDIPILIQSSSTEYEEKAKEIGVGFVQKGSPRLLHQLREFMLDKFGFGDFIFYTPDGRQVGRATNLKTLEEQLKLVPDESILFHSERNDFSNWLKARTEFWLAHQLRPKTISDFNSTQELRNLLINSLHEYLDRRQRGTITDFDKEFFNPNNTFARIGGGSLGGKARGLGFINTLITDYNIRSKFPGVEINVPSAVVVATDVYDTFLAENNLESFALNEQDDDVIRKRFIDSVKFPADIVEKLKDFLDIMRYPLAIRSSSLLEDSQFQPFAGVYDTIIIPNSHKDDKIRLKELLDSIKTVYASTFFKAAKDYIKATSYRLEEEKMAVVVQRLVGSRHGERFYPDFAGVAKSYNFYPVKPQKSTDGIAHAALGLGKLVVEGGNTVRFCPKYPRHLLQFFSARETVKSAQQEFYALDLNLAHNKQGEVKDYIHKYNLDCAEEDGTLNYVGSTYSAENEAIYDGISRIGSRVVTFAPVLKHKTFPLAEVLELLLELGTWGMGTPIEVEFAVNLDVPPGDPKEFAMLQIRPLVISREIEELSIEDMPEESLVCQSNQVLGNGYMCDICDIVYVDIDKYDRAKSRDVVLEISRLNSKLLEEKRPYILIGIGRWGSLDPWLGIPVTWDQISGANVIVESGFKDFNVDPSQGSHFFQNITSFRIGYFTVKVNDPGAFVNWEWLKNQPPVEQLTYTTHLRFEKPLIVKMNGHQNKGMILKPEL